LYTNIFWGNTIKKFADPCIRGPTHLTHEIFKSAEDKREKLNMTRKHAVRKRNGETESRLNTRLLEADVVVQIHARGNKVKGYETIEHSSHTYDGNIAYMATCRDGIDCANKAKTSCNAMNSPSLSYFV
jgi:uncharacterized membrane protein